MKSIPPRYLQIATIALVVVGVLLLALSGYLRPVVGAAMDPLVSVQRWFSTRYLAIYQFLTVPRDMASIQNRNAELEAEVAQLQTQVIELQQQLSEAQVVYALLDFARERPENQYVAASVIGRDPSPFLHYVIIDHGSDDGVRHGMPVVTDQGLVGRIDAVTAQAARVQLITDPSAVVNIHLQSLDVEAELEGSITGEVTVQMLPQDVEIPDGEIVLTSGLGGGYPQDILVGQITSVQTKQNDIFQTASVQPVVDFSSLSAVLIITNFQPVEIEPLTPTISP